MEWKIDVLYYGYMEFFKNWVTKDIDADLKIKMPYLGFLLRNGRQNILIDNGINSRYIVDGKAWAGMSAEGGEKFVLEALEKAGVKPKDIEIVAYTHLHNDHNGNAHLFPEAKHVMQRTEWNELLSPTPYLTFLTGHDLETIPVLRKSDCVFVDGNFELAPGIMCYMTPGHTQGSMSFVVEGKKGLYCIVGDLLFWHCSIYPQMDKITLMDGKQVKITPVPKERGLPMPNLCFDQTAWFHSTDLIRAICRSKEFALCGHEPSLVGKVF
jgi:N-acyl homoserine lactone hydrolase